MATARRTANVALQALLVTPLHMKVKFDAINIDNQGASGKITVQIQDDFTQDISNLVAAPVARSAFPFQASVPQGNTFIADQLMLKEIEGLGNIGVLCSATDAGCVITVDYHFE